MWNRDRVEGLIECILNLPGYGWKPYLEDEAIRFSAPDGHRGSGVKVWTPTTALCSFRGLGNNAPMLGMIDLVVTAQALDEEPVNLQCIEFAIGSAPDKWDLPDKEKPYAGYYQDIRARFLSALGLDSTKEENQK